ncbi:MAG: hypothetical protein LBM68_03980, partial [Bacteroidales bacterium]|nr:hypothetical protein [Bacteroidales bacterium]
FNRGLATETANGEYFVTLDNAIIPTSGEYKLTAIYHVITPAPNSRTCSSTPQVTIVRMNPRPNPPIVSSKIICQGTELEPLHAFGSPLVQWIFKDGPMTLPDGVGETYDFNDFNFKEIAVGKYAFELFDIDALTQCVSLTVPLGFEVAPAAETKIIGETKLCATTSLEEPYSIEVVPTESSSYVWNTSGDVYNYSKDGNPFSPSRYIDWHKAGIDTVYVKETTWAGCEGFDTLVVFIAPYPVAHYTWSLPGAGTTIEFLDSSFQAPIRSRYDENAEPVQLEYSMAWNFDKIPNNDPNYFDLLVPYENRNQPITVDNYTYGFKYPLLTVTNEYGCAHSYSTEIFVDIRAGVYLPNAFSPTNAAASVRVFKPVAFNLESGKFWIYDKWGNLLFFSEEVENGMFAGEWNGTYNGQLLQSDVYIWKLEAKFLDGTSWPGQKKPSGGYSKFGSVTLIR